MICQDPLPRRESTIARQREALHIKLGIRVFALVQDATRGSGLRRGRKRAQPFTNAGSSIEQYVKVPPTTIGLAGQTGHFFPKAKSDTAQDSKILRPHHDFRYCSDKGAERIRSTNFLQRSYSATVWQSHSLERSE